MRPEPRTLLSALLMLASTAVNGQGNFGDWYRTEILVFARTDAQAFSQERWNPLPDLAYPTSYRFLIDPMLADARLSLTNADASRLDPLGVQRLKVPSVAKPEDGSPRPDSALEPALSPEAVERPDAILAPEDRIDDSAAGDAQAGVNAPADALTTDAGDKLIDDDAAETALLRAIPYEQLTQDQLDLSAGASQLMREGHTVLLHTAWWAPLGGAEAMLPIAIDRAGDPDLERWPVLQGSVHIYRSRYLHVSLDLWLNTDGRYLLDGWSMPSPPVPRASLIVADQYGTEVDPFAEPPGILDFLGQTHTTSSDEAPLVVVESAAPNLQDDNLQPVQDDLPASGRTTAPMPI